MSPQPHVIVLFGARGDLAKRKLFPGLFHLTQADLMPGDFRIIGSGRHEPDGDFADDVREILSDEDDGVDAFAEKVSFVQSSADDGENLAQAVQQAREELGEGTEVLLYLSVPPSAMTDMVGMLGDTGLNADARIIMEKPFGSDLETAKELNAALHEHFGEDQIFRIDHFLGKEAAQDILALRFANRLVEPIWNREHIAAVQIDVPEELGLEGRGSFYEETGALRDMVVTHLAQILGLIALDAPESLDPDDLRDAKKAVFDALRPLEADEVVFGQFDTYHDDEDVADDSDTETFVAARMWIDNDRWRDVPFLLRTGKAMADSRRAVTVVLRDPRHALFDVPEGDRPDELWLELGDDPQFEVRMRVKVPGPKLEVAQAALTLDVEKAIGGNGLEAYERLLLDAMKGDQLLFTRADEVERLWEIVAPVLDSPRKPVAYEQGSWGPEEAVALAEPAGWRLPDDA